MNRVARISQNVLAGVVLVAGCSAAEERNRNQTEAQYQSSLADCNHCPALVSILNNLGHLYYAAGRYAEAGQMFDKALAASEADGSNELALLPFLNNVALLSRQTADYDRAREIAKRAVAIAELHDTAQTLEGATAFANLGEIAESLGEAAEARKWLSRALPVRERLLGFDHPLVAETLSDLALTYRVEHQFKRAVELYHRALGILEATPETALSSKSLGAVLNNLGQVEAEEGHFKEAEQILRKSVTELERTVGPQHPNTAAGLANLANVLRSRRRYPEAEEALRRAEQIDRLRFAPDHTRIARDLNLEAILAFDRKKYAEAERLFTEALAILTKRLPAGHREIGRATANLAEVYFRQKRAVEAEQAYANALTILEQAVGRDNPELLPTMEHYSQLLRARQDFATAAGLDARVMKIRVTQTLKRAA
jgi:tetratricopeptide (TPR) repeat protein